MIIFRYIVTGNRSTFYFILFYCSPRNRIINQKHLGKIKLIVRKKYKCAPIMTYLVKNS